MASFIDESLSQSVAVFCKYGKRIPIFGGFCKDGDSRALLFMCCGVNVLISFLAMFRENPFHDMKF